MGQPLLHQEWLVEETCCNCGIAFAMPQGMQMRLKERGGSFYCPNGHGQHYTKTDNQKLQERLAEQIRVATREAQRAARAEELVAVAEKAVTNLTRKNKALKTRAKNGVCPCCNRTFAQLARHMKAKHPSYK